MLRLRDLFLHRRKQAFPTTVPKIDIFINREHIFEDSYRILMALSPTQLLGKLNIKFLNEDALDYGGVAREWFFQLSKEIFNPYYGLFEQLNSDQYLLNVSSHSGINPDHLSYFKFVGRVMGLAVVNGQFLDGCFVTTIYKMLLQKPVSLEDMAQVDVAFYNGLKWMLDNNITGVLENTFSDEKNVFGISETVELCPNGAAMPVTEENKSQYVKLIVKFRLVNGIDEQACPPFLLLTFGSPSVAVTCSDFDCARCRSKQCVVDSMKWFPHRSWILWMKRNLSSCLVD
eukprot:m.762610 g.762610  ORF g.762610 m.762610 type:complete len:287 (+) comp59051_c0_seq29:1885-2745(+)